MLTALHESLRRSPPTRWSLYAGLYMFVWAVVLAFAMNDLLGLLGEVIGLPPAFALVVLASPPLVLGTALWWTLVERRESYSYPFAAAFGLLTALLTGILWTLRFVMVWGSEMLTAGVVPVLVAFVVGVATVVGGVVGLPLMYARRRLGGAERDSRVLTDTAAESPDT